jgi:hypothetical protein
MGRDEWLQRPFWENVLQLPSGSGIGQWGAIQSQVQMQMQTQLS